MLSHGIPMLLAGDEIGRTQNGNNNAYCQDNAVSWINWDLLNENKEIYNFFEKIIAFRKKHPILRVKEHYETLDSLGSRYPEVSFHGLKPWELDNSYDNRSFAIMFYDKHADNDIIYLAMNMDWETKEFNLPKLMGMDWYTFADTFKHYPNDICEVGNECLLKNQSKLVLGPRSIVILVGRKASVSLPTVPFS
jgi:glycogen operon protein